MKKIVLLAQGFIIGASIAAPEYSATFVKNISVMASKRVIVKWPGAGDVCGIFADGNSPHPFDWVNNTTLVLDPGRHEVALAAYWNWGHTCTMTEEEVFRDIQVVDPCGRDSYYGYKTVVSSSKIRENDPTVLDVTYTVFSDKPKVKVRVLAFENGERSFAKVVRPETFVDGTAENVGDEITANVEHKISWKVSSDWQTKLAKLKFEVMASLGEILPLETMTIPASEWHRTMKITWNTINDSQVFDALMWLYADKDPELTLVNGELKNGNRILASGTTIEVSNGSSSTYVEWQGYVIRYTKSAPEYVYSKMGYSLLTGAPLTYANQETRLGLSPSGARQYGYKIVE